MSSAKPLTCTKADPQQAQCPLAHRAPSARLTACRVDRARQWLPLMAAGLLATLPACDTFTKPKPKPGGLPPYLVRMQDTYPELSSGRFLCLAHFEAAGQAELFRVTGLDGDTGDRPQPTLSILRSRPETGGGGLYATIASPADELRFDGVRSDTLALIRDWRGYPLLLFSVYGPPNSVRLRFSVSSGDETTLTWSRIIRLQPGWNQVTIDTAEIGDEVDLSDVRCLTWQLLDEPIAPLDLFLDDVILADNTEYEFGEDAGPGELYVFRQGRRTHAGAHDRFELAFADGQIVAWYAGSPPSESTVAAQPTSIELVQPDDDEDAPLPRPNLAARRGIGPHPVPLADNWADPGTPPPAWDAPDLFADWGQAVIAEQWLREASPTRIVIQGQWQFAAGGGLPTGQAARQHPAHLWQYVIYPNGEIYVVVATSLPGDRAWPTPQMGCVIALDGRQGFDPLVTNRPPGVLFARPGYAADLVWIPHDPALLATARRLASGDQRTIAVLGGARPTAALLETAHLIRIWPHDINAAADAETFAADYRQPASVHCDVGELITDASGDLDHDGYNEGHGCWELRPAEDKLRWHYAPDKIIRHAPRFRIHDSQDRDCWVYVDGRVLGNLPRDRDGRVLFTLPTVIDRPVELEAHLGPARPVQTP